MAVWGWRLRGFGEIIESNSFLITRNEGLLCCAAQNQVEAFVGGIFGNGSDSTQHFFGLTELGLPRNTHFHVKRGLWSATICQLREGRHSGPLPCVDQWLPREAARTNIFVEQTKG